MMTSRNLRLWQLLVLLLTAVGTAWGQSGSNGVYGGYVGSSAWFSSMREAAANRAMLRALGGSGSGSQAVVPPGYIEVAGIIHFTVRNPFPDGQLPDLHIVGTNPASDGVIRSPYINKQHSSAPSFYTVVKRGLSYRFSWMYFFGSQQQLGTWTVPDNAPRQVRLVLNVDMKGNAVIEAPGSRGIGIASPEPEAESYPSSIQSNPPASRSGRTSPAYDSSPSTAPSMSRYTPPRSDGNFTPPQSDRAFTPPRSDGSFLPPRSDGSFTPPRSDRASTAASMATATPAPPAAPQVDLNQFDLGGLSTPPKNAQEARLWREILEATTTVQKASAHQALSTYYRSQGNTQLSLREAQRARYWSGKK